MLKQQPLMNITMDPFYSDIPPHLNQSEIFIVPDIWSLAIVDNLRQSLGGSITLIVAYVSIFITGAFGNILVISVISKKPLMGAATNLFLINLAVADLLVILFCVPATLIANLYKPWILGSFMCKAVAYVQGVAVCASAYSLAALSLDRCKAIFQPIKRHQGMTKHQALITIIIIWAFSLFITLPWLFSFEVLKAEEDGQVYCLEIWKNEHLEKVYFFVANLLCCYVIPLGLICFSNTAVWCHVARRYVPQDSVTIKRMHKQTRHDVKKTLGTVTLAFLLSWLPLYAIAIRIKLTSLENMGEWESSILSFVLPFAQWLGSFNSSVNPVLYVFVNSKFRDSFRNLVFRRTSANQIICSERSHTIRKPVLKAAHQNVKIFHIQIDENVELNAIGNDKSELEHDSHVSM